MNVAQMIDCINELLDKWPDASLETTGLLDVSPETTETTTVHLRVVMDRMVVAWVDWSDGSVHELPEPAPLN